MSMVITPVSHGLDGVLLQSGGPRSGGLHVSDIYNDMYQQLDPAKYKPFEEDAADPQRDLQLALGLAWEQYLEKCFIAAGLDIKRPGEFKTAEGVAFSPDLIITENGEQRVGEIKLTRMGLADTLTHPKFSKWLTQAKTYCYHLGIPQARFYVLFINGDYKERRGPHLCAYDISFTEAGLVENWVKLVNHAESRGMLP